MKGPLNSVLSIPSPFGGGGGGLPSGSALTGYYLTNDQSGFGTAGKLIEYDTPITDQFAGFSNPVALGLSISAGVITIGSAAANRYASVRGMVYTITDTNTAIDYAMSRLDLSNIQTRYHWRHNATTPFSHTFASGRVKDYGAASICQVYCWSADAAFSAKAGSYVVLEFVQ